MTQPTTQTSRNYWRSLDELRQTPEFEQFLHREFPVAASEYPKGISRRRWIQLMGASLAMGGAIGCRYPEETIAPFVIRPEGRIPGEAYSRATNFQWAGRVHHLLVSCVDGRPLKIEGNADHPTSNGGTDHYVQASVLQLYDPDRMHSVIRKQDGKRAESNWQSFETFAAATMKMLQGAGGHLAVLMPPTSSPSLARMVARLREAAPATVVCVYDSVGQGVTSQAVAQATGTAATPRYNVGEAKIVVDVMADLLGTHPGFVANAAGFSAGRTPGDSMNRLYVVEPGFSTTGMSADSRLALRPSQIVPFLSALERAVDAAVAAPASATAGEEKPFDQIPAEERVARFIEVLAQDLAGAQGSSLVAVGDAAGADAVAAGLRINAKLGAIGKSVTFSQPAASEIGETVAIGDLVAQIEAGQVEALLILGGNPVFTAPSDLSLGKAISRVENSIYLGEYDDETAVLCQWALPAAHPLESWGDVVGETGYYGVCQPHILPLMNGRTEIELIARMLGDDETAGEQIVRRTADASAGGSLSDRQWRELLARGYADNMIVEPSDVTVATDGAVAEGSPIAIDGKDLEPTALRDSVEVVFVPSDGLYDGRFANNAWLQEMPQSLTKLTWDNAALMTPATAEALGVRHGVMIALSQGEATVELPVFEVPGMAAGVIIVPYGYGRTRAGAVGGHVDLDAKPVGFDVGPLRISGAMMVAAGIKARPRPRSEYDLATTQNHWAIDELGRNETIDRSYQLVREGTSALYEQLNNFAEFMGVHSPPVGSLWEEPIEVIEEKRPELPQWGMAIDLSKCIGCNACVVACQSENNVPIVGKEQVLMGREMHWMRIDRYFQGTAEQADVVQEPMLCQHCETAPCEQVCPVAATVHTDDGINAMAYNRCIGTRYCANNCPFKVRRFNYFNWNEDIGVGYGINAYESNIESANRKLQQLVLNPEVTVRGRGVMEKCTFCVQRVEAGKIKARQEGGRKIEDGEIKTACQTACPTQAIVFGNIMDDAAEVTKLRHDPRNYAMLDQLNIKPRTTYLARIANTHPRLMTEKQIWALKHWPEVAEHHAAHAGEHGSEHADEHASDEHATSADEHATPTGSAAEEH